MSQIQESMLRITCANQIINLVSLISAPDNTTPSRDVISDALLGAKLMIDDAQSKIAEEVM